MSQLNKHNSDPKIGYMKAIKKVVHYLKGIIPLKLIYKVMAMNKGETKVPIILSPFGLIGYRDSNYTKNSENKKSIMRYCYFINRVIILWYKKK